MYHRTTLINKVFFYFYQRTSSPALIDLHFTSPYHNHNYLHSRNCFQNYLDFYRCTNLRGEDYEPCQYFKKSFKTICPNDWIARWDEQREEGRFPADLTK